MASTSMPASVEAILAAGGSVITGTDRAARFLERCWAEANRSAGRTDWPAASVLSWSAWTKAVWQRLAIRGGCGEFQDRILLNHSQELELWRRIVRNDKASTQSSGSDTLAEMAQDAYRCLCHWNGRKNLRGSATSVDTLAFERWAFTFEQECTRDGFIVEARLEEVLRSYASLSLDQRILAFYGFDGLTPSQETLLAHMDTQGFRVQLLPAPEIDAEHVVRLVEAASEAEELRVATRWIVEKTEREPDGRFALIVPQLQKKRTAIERAFFDSFACVYPSRDRIDSDQIQGVQPGREEEAGSMSTDRVEFSLGRPLLELLPILGALDLLRWSAEVLPLDRISSLLTSGLLDPAASERGAAAEYDAYVLRRAALLRPEASLAWLIDSVAGSQLASRLPALLRSLRRLERAAEGLGFMRVTGTLRRSYTEWADAIRELLDAADWGQGGFGGGEAASAFDRRVERRWTHALNELAMLDVVCGDRGKVSSDRVKPDFRDARGALEGICARTIFAEPSRNAPIQVLGALEAAGSHFDAVWLMQAGDAHWPLRTPARPLLSRRLQRQLGMPGSDFERDSEAAIKLTARITGSSSMVFCSFATIVERAGGAVSKQRRSSALEQMRLERTKISSFSLREDARVPKFLERVPDDAIVPSPPAGVTRGGASVLQAQAACGFKAFAERRLSATVPEAVMYGFSALQSGSLVHGILERFWTEVRDQETLKAMTYQERDVAISRASYGALKDTGLTVESVWDEAYLQVQQERILRLLRPWLDLELQRPSFTVLSSEQELREAEIGPLQLTVRVDRVDRVYAPDGSDAGVAIIDYKTGLANPAEWEGARPDKPQLPLYAVMAGGDLGAVAFGSVRAGSGLALSGYEAMTGVLPRAAKLPNGSLQEKVQTWRQVLTSLAEDFYASEAAVSPKEYPGTCKHCQQRLICRLDPTLLEGDSEEIAAIRGLAAQIETIDG